ncbi:hypothetical protein HZA97_10065 [Candidatus Woesearchaeota archaeon]|nr:hypothetical protein [Candidatus Woesearchaeota archaeon]
MLSDYIEQAYEAISNEDYLSAKGKLVHCLEFEDGFNIRYGLAVCQFNEFLSDKRIHKLDLAIQHATKALEFFYAHFDVHFLLAQCYATKYKSTKNRTFKKLALNEYRTSKSLASSRPDVSSDELESRVEELVKELHN